MQGTVAEIASGGQPAVMTGVDDGAAAERLVLDHPALSQSGAVAGGIRLVLSDASEAALELAATPLLMNVELLGVLRELLLGSATRRIQPFPSNETRIGMSLLAAIVVLVLWIVVPLAAGAWRTATRDA